VTQPVTFEELPWTAQRGAEIAAELFPKEGWRLRATYAFLDLELRREPDSRDPISTSAAGATPRHEGTLWSYLALSRGVELDVGARAASDLASRRVPGFFTVDSRLEWQVNERLTLSLVARNLVGSHHVEFDVGQERFPGRARRGRRPRVPRPSGRHRGGRARGTKASPGPVARHGRGRRGAAT
jgi:outer membrane receptor for monomeric catechols